MSANIRLVRRSGNRRALYRPVDVERDQSYFLFATTPDQLDFIRFPLGAMTKADVRAAAREFGLAIADKHDSQDICFVPQGRYTDVVEKLKPGAVRPGEIVHLDGRVLGRHEGVIRYTVGQRRGLGGEPPALRAPKPKSRNTMDTSTAKLHGTSVQPIPRRRRCVLCHTTP